MSQASFTTGLPMPKNYDSVHASILGNGLYTQEKVKPLEEYLLQQVGGCHGKGLGKGMGRTDVPAASKSAASCACCALNAGKSLLFSLSLSR